VTAVHRNFTSIRKHCFCTDDNRSPKCVAGGIAAFDITLHPGRCLVARELDVHGDVHVHLVVITNGR